MTATGITASFLIMGILFGLILPWYFIQLGRMFAKGASEYISKAFDDKMDDCLQNTIDKE